MTLPLIAFIAPHEELAVQAEKVVQDGGFLARVWRGDLDNGLRFARSALEQGVKVIISQGETARIIQAELLEELPTEVVEVEASWRGLMSRLHAHARSDERVAIAGSPRFVKAGHLAAEDLNIPHRVFEIARDGDPAATERAITEWKADVVIGDVSSQPLRKNLPGIGFDLVGAHLDSVWDALERALLLVNNLRRMIADNRRLSMVLDCTQAGAIIVDDDGVIEMFNQSAMSLLDIAGPRPIGSRVEDILMNGEMKAAIRAKRETRGILLEHAGEQLHVNVIPLNRADGASYGLVVSFQRVKNIQAVERQIRNRLHHRGFHARYALHDIVHEADSMRHAVRLAHAYAGSDANLVITGETGTGKELFAQGIHNASPRAKGMFVAINCATLPGTLLESELFGYSSGAFTGATRQGKMGLFETAHNGTIFLDEISEMDPHLQSHLLRAIQEREIMRIGDNRTIPVNVRVIAAANKGLEDEVVKGNLRQDLFFRLNVLNLHLPALRERPGDAPLLFHHFLAQYARRTGEKPAVPDGELLRQIDEYAWPGNVRELENAVEKYVALRDMPEGRDLLAHPVFGVMEP